VNLQARLSSDFIWQQSRRGKASKLTLLQPANGQLRSGQLISFSAPSSLGKPTDISIGTRAAVPLGDVVHEDGSPADEMSTYVACMVLLPVDSGNDGHLVITFGDKVLMTSESVMLHG